MRILLSEIISNIKKKRIRSGTALHYEKSDNKTEYETWSCLSHRPRFELENMRRHTIITNMLPRHDNMSHRPGFELENLRRQTKKKCDLVM